MPTENRHDRGGFSYAQMEVTTILDWIFEGMATWVASMVTQIMDAISGVFLNALGTDMAAMEDYFPFVAMAFEVMQYTAWAILLLMTVWQLFRVFGGPLTEAEHPLHLLVRSSVFAFLIGYAKPIFLIVLDIARAPYLALMDASMDPGDFTFAGIEEVLTSGLTTLVSTASIVGLLLIAILMIALGWNYFKLLLEAIERYILAGVLCYTSPLAFAMGGTKATQKVFASWCRMVGSQMLMLIMNVWFLRGFNSSVGAFMANGGALSGGGGNIFLWLFCALAFLKTAQKFDSYLASVGMSVAQTGSSMGFEMMMAARAVTGFAGGGMKSAGSIFKGGSAAAGAAGAGGTAASGGFMAGFASKLNPNSFVRDAVVDGGSKMGAGGGLGFVGRTFGGMAARNGATLSGDSISSVASRPPAASGRIAGDIADRSLGSYMPQMAGKTVSGTQIAGGHISTTATGASGKEAAVDMFSAAQYDAPASPHTTVAASDGSQWYQMASGAGMGDFYSTPAFTGAVSEAAQVAEAFPDITEGTSLRTVDAGMIETSHPESGSSMLLSSAFYQEPAAPHDVMTASDGLSWYAMHPSADMPQFEPGDAATAFNQAQFQQFMPGYEQGVSNVDAARRDDGTFEVRHSDGSGTAFYDKTKYQSPRGDYQVYEDRKGGQWYAIPGTPTVERKPVYENGKPVYDGDVLRTVNVEKVKYKTALTKFDAPQHRDVNDRKPPKRKQ